MGCDAHTLQEQKKKISHLQESADDHRMADWKERGGVKESNKSGKHCREGDEKQSEVVIAGKRETPCFFFFF